MVSKLEIEQYCNRYEELFALVHALETNSIGEEEFKRLDTECHNLCGYLEKASSLKTDCKSLEYGPFHGVAYIGLQKEKHSECSRGRLRK